MESVLMQVGEPITFPSKISRYCKTNYLPTTQSLKFGYADYWTIVTQSITTILHLESVLDMGRLDQYFDYGNYVSTQ